MVKHFSDPPAMTLTIRALSLTVKQFSDKEQSDGSTPSERTISQGEVGRDKEEISAQNGGIWPFIFTAIKGVNSFSAHGRAEAQFSLSLRTPIFIVINSARQSHLRLPRPDVTSGLAMTIECVSPVLR